MCRTGSGFIYVIILEQKKNIRANGGSPAFKCRAGEALPVACPAWPAPGLGDSGLDRRDQISERGKSRPSDLQWRQERLGRPADSVTNRGRMTTLAPGRFINLGA